MNSDFVERLRTAFGNASMADVARRLKIPHATVRNYYQGRLPAPEVLIKIANETGVSLNWLLIGKGDRYAGQVAPIGLGRFIEEKIGQIIDEKLETVANQPDALRDYQGLQRSFDLKAAVRRLNDPQAIMNEWFQFEGRECPQDYGVIFFRGWETFSFTEKADAIADAKKVLDRSLRSASKTGRPAD